MSDYERLVELAAKGLAERDNHPMPQSVTTPEEFYEVMAGAALDAIGLRELLEEVEVARARQELTIRDEAPPWPVKAGAVTAQGDGPPQDSHPTPNADSATESVAEDDPSDPRSQRERDPRGIETIRLRREWAATAEEHLAVVTDAVAELRKIFDRDEEVDSEVDADVASKLIAACGSLAEWLGNARAPKGLAKAGGELGAAAGVYLNAAIVFGRRNEVQGQKRHVRSNACVMLLEQGDQHVDVFVAAVAKKLSL